MISKKNSELVQTLNLVCDILKKGVSHSNLRTGAEEGGLSLDR